MMSFGKGERQNFVQCQRLLLFNAILSTPIDDKSTGLSVIIFVALVEAIGFCNNVGLFVFFFEISWGLRAIN